MFKPLTAILSILLIADVWTTQIGIQNGLRESNSLMQSVAHAGVIEMLTVKLLFLLVSILTAIGVSKLTKSKLLGSITLTGPVLIHGFVVTTNLLLIYQFF